MTIVGAYEAKTHLPSLLQRVEGGEEILITRHGRPVARLLPLSTTRRRGRLREAVQAIRELRQGARLDGLTIRELVEEGRRL